MICHHEGLELGGTVKVELGIPPSTGTQKRCESTPTILLLPFSSIQIVYLEYIREHLRGAKIDTSLL
jgi:hypothetical protein